MNNNRKMFLMICCLFISSAFGADEIDKARKCIEKTDNYIHYIFKELEEDDN